MKKFFNFFLIIFLILPSVAKADGGMIPRGYKNKDIYEPSQMALIVFDDNKEDLYLQVNYEGETSDFVWIIPSPSFPKASEAPADIFKELSAFTGGDLELPTLKSDNIFAGSQVEEVIVHSQEEIGDFEVTVLSSNGADSLFNWLKDNDYGVTENIRSTLDWYVKKEWYFTAVKINKEDLVSKAILELKKIDSTVNKNNFSAKLASFIVAAIKDLNFEDFDKFSDILDIILDEDDVEEFDNYDEEEFKELFSKLDDKDEYWWIKAKEDLKEEADIEIKKINENKNKGEIDPLKISFASERLVYPLKISEISTRVPDRNDKRANEILLYVMNSNFVYAPGFKYENSKKINKSSLNNFSGHYSLGDLKKIVGDKEYYLTKLRRTFAREEMDQDLYFVNYIDGDSEAQYMKLRDSLRVLGVLYLRNALEMYYTEMDEYPTKLEDLLDKKIVSEFPLYPEIGEEGYKYQTNGQDFILSWKFEFGAVGYGSGTCSVNGMDGSKCSSLYKGYGPYKFNPLSESYEADGRFGEFVKAKGSAMADRLQGKIVIKVEDEGKAYYVNPKNKYKYYLGRPADAFNVMRNHGVGISNVDLEKIEIGYIEASGVDADGDGLSDMFEDAIGTDKNNNDTDSDSYLDGDEVMNGYSPKGPGRIQKDNVFAGKQKGKILLQVEGNGEAWYLNPNDNKRYFLGRPDDAFNVMRELGLGISNNDFDKL